MSYLSSGYLQKSADVKFIRSVKSLHYWRGLSDNMTASIVSPWAQSHSISTNCIISIINNEWSELFQVPNDANHLSQDFFFGKCSVNKLLTRAESTILSSWLRCLATFISQQRLSDNIRLHVGRIPMGKSGSSNKKQKKSIAMFRSYDEPLQAANVSE